jgi:hypothetical protein
MRSRNRRKGMMMTLNGDTTPNRRHSGILWSNDAGEELVVGLLYGHTGVRERKGHRGLASVAPYMRPLV